MNSRAIRSRGKRRFSRMLGSVHLALFWITALVVAGIFVPILFPDGQTEIDLLARLKPPLGFGGTAEHVLGTDQLGRDILVRLCSAIRVSLLLALFGTLAGACIGISAGFAAAHFGGIIDDVVTTLIDLQAALPFVVLAVASIAFLGANMLVLLLLVSLYGWERYARLARGLALSHMNNRYISAARAYGASWPAIYWRHILPNISGVLVVNATLNFPESMLLETTLSFLGLGVQPPNASLGSIMNAGRDHLFSAWWITVIPGVLIFLTTFSLSILGDALNGTEQSQRAA
ncbi:ABC transporter permease [Stappia sp.]|uniref:ABC transporter permease n=1 Tax=Stappia sp. TaxID=1870903 RepID=UPI003A99C96F